MESLHSRPGLNVQLEAARATHPILDLHSLSGMSCEFSECASICAHCRPVYMKAQRETKDCCDRVGPSPLRILNPLPSLPFLCSFSKWIAFTSLLLGQAQCKLE